MERILSLSYGKDSLACLEACKLLGYQIDRVIHAEVWATDTIQADLPPMVEFKKKADKIIKDRYDLAVEHYAAERNGERLSYEKQFYTMRFSKRKNKQINYGFPVLRLPWCNSKLKIKALHQAFRGLAKDIEMVQYLGIAADEPERIARHTRPGVILPLVDIGWDEAYCRKWCEENDLLSPIYSSSTRGGCWFCHNQSVGQLRLLRKNYPELWGLLLKWDQDSPVDFRPDGRKVRSYELRFRAEDLGLAPTDRTFQWSMLENLEL